MLLETPFIREAEPDMCRPVPFINCCVPELKGTPFRPGVRGTYQDARRGVTVRIPAQKGDSYELAVSNGR